jgi:hypothetical protein
MTSFAKAVQLPCPSGTYAVDLYYHIKSEGI